VNLGYYIYSNSILMGKTGIVIGLLLLWLAAPAQQPDSIQRQDSSGLPRATVSQPTLRQQPASPRRQAVLRSRQPDSLVRQDSAVRQSDTVFQNPIPSDTPKVITPVFSLFSDSSLYNHHPYFSFTNPAKRLTEKRAWQGKEPLFYSTVALLIFFALVRNHFSRYATDLFALFFRTTIKQRQVKEQLMQAPLPSLLLNIVFFISGALFINLLLAQYGLGRAFGFWLLFLYAILGLIAIYLLKFITLKVCGWLFRMSDVTDAYTFVVFTTNKIIGIALLPFIILLAFTTGPFRQGILSLSILVVVLLFLYRFYLSFATIERKLKISFFHFLLYLVGLEIVPLLLINKLLFRFLGESS